MKLLIAGFASIARCFLPVDLYDRSIGGTNERKRQLRRRRVYWRRDGMVQWRK
jgi:hypothetical protein